MPNDTRRGVQLTVAKADLPARTDGSPLVPTDCIGMRREQARLRVTRDCSYSRFVANQHTVTGILAYVPDAARNSPAYCRFGL